MLGYS